MVRNRKQVGLAALGLMVLAVAGLVWAWRDGGREPVRELSVPVALPGVVR